MPKDTRTYITLHDGVMDSRKIKPRSDKAFRTWIELLSWCSRELSDGRIPADVFTMFGTPKSRNELITAGLVERQGSDFSLHDYLEHQRSKEEVLALRKSRSEAGRRGGLARAAQANAQASAQANGKQSSSKSAPVSVSVSDPSPNGEGGGGAVAPTTTAEKPKRGARIPNEFYVDAGMREWAAREIPGFDYVPSTRRFVDYWRAESGTKAVKLDWAATWRNWVRKDYEHSASPNRSRPANAVEKGRSSDQAVMDWLGYDPTTEQEAIER